MFKEFIRTYLGAPPSFNSYNLAEQFEYIAAVCLLLICFIVILKLVFSFFNLFLK